MKKIKYLSFLIISFFAFININEAASNPYGKWQTLYGATTVRCTWYAWDQAYNLGGVALPGWGNAETWYASAKKAGYSVGRVAKGNSIAVYSSSDGYGHVAYVVSVSGNEMIVNEGGVIKNISYPCSNNSDEICYKTVPAGDNGIVNNSHVTTEDGSLIGFIYLNDAPKKTNTSNTNNNSNISNNNKVNNTKSSNNNLQELKIEGMKLDFDKEKEEYEVEVPYETKIIKISAKAEDKKAVVTGTGEKALELGDNIYSIVVKAENGKLKEYKIKIVREEKKEEEQETKVNEQPIIKVSKKTNSTPIIIGISVGTILILFLLVIIIFKIKKNKKFADNKKIEQKPIDKNVKK